MKDELANWSMTNDEMRFREERKFSHRSLAEIAWWKCRIPNGAVRFATFVNYFASPDSSPSGPDFRAINLVFARRVIPSL